MLCRLWPWLSKAVLKASFQQQFWGLRACQSNTQRLKLVLIASECTSLASMSLQLALHTWAFYQKGIFIWKLITGFILICVWWWAEKRKCSLLLPEIQNRNDVRLFHLHPYRQRPWGGGAARAATMAMEPESPITHVSLWLCLGLCLLWVLVQPWQFVFLSSDVFTFHSTPGSHSAALERETS